MGQELEADGHLAPVVDSVHAAAQPAVSTSPAPFETKSHSAV